jgi:hypothetical protein
MGCPYSRHIFTQAIHMSHQTSDQNEKKGHERERDTVKQWDTNKQKNYASYQASTVSVTPLGMRYLFDSC